MRGPFAAYFVWNGEEPVLLLGGGSGVVPLMAMLRHKRRRRPDWRCGCSTRCGVATDVIYAAELAAGDETQLTYTRVPPPGWDGHTRPRSTPR